jgi:hypothetical protein
MLVTGIVVSCYLLVRATEVEQARSSCDHCGAQQVAWFLASAHIYVGIGLLCDLGLGEPEEAWPRPLVSFRRLRGSNCAKSQGLSSSVVPGRV